MNEKRPITKGIVTGIEPYGIFLKIDDENIGLIHISELSSKFVKNPADFANVGDEMTVEILENENGHMKLSIKNLNENKSYKRKRKIVETSLGFKTLEYKLPFWIEENLKNHKNNSISIDK